MREIETCPLGLTRRKFYEKQFLYLKSFGRKTKEDEEGLKKTERGQKI